MSPFSVCVITTGWPASVVGCASIVALCFVAVYSCQSFSGCTVSCRTWGGRGSLGFILCMCWVAAQAVMAVSQYGTSSACCKIGRKIQLILRSISRCGSREHWDRGGWYGRDIALYKCRMFFSPCSPTKLVHVFVSAPV